MRYFDHDTTAGSDDKLMALRLEFGSVAIDCYWTLLEKMYADEGPLNLVGSNLETKSVLHRLNIGFEDLETYVNQMVGLGLFEGTLSDLKSARAMENIEAYRQKCETARQNGKLGGRKPKGETEGKPSRFQSGNQTAKLRKEKKGMESYSLSNPVPPGAPAGGTAAPAEDIAAIFEEVDAAFGHPSIAEAEAAHREAEEHLAELADGAVPCPFGDFAAFVGAGGAQ